MTTLKILIALFTVALVGYGGATLKKIDHLYKLEEQYFDSATAIHVRIIIYQQQEIRLLRDSLSIFTHKTPIDTMTTEKSRRRLLTPGDGKTTEKKRIWESKVKTLDVKEKNLKKFFETVLIQNLTPDEFAELMRLANKALDTYALKKSLNVA